jgi:hypothetical protein
MFTDQQRRHLAHIYAALRECVADEVAYDREPEFAPFDENTGQVVLIMIMQQITNLMVAAHAEEAATIEAALDATHGGGAGGTDAVVVLTTREQPV